MASVRQIAKASRVSVATVSRALNDDASVAPATRERVLRAASDAGYVAAGQGGRRVSTLVGLAYTYPQDHCPYDALVLAGIVRGVGERRFDVALLNLWRDKATDETYTQFFRRRGVRGVVLRTTPGSRNVCRAIAEEGFPAVVVGDRFDDAPHVSRVVCESESDSRAAVEHLIHLGHRRIGIALHGRPDDGDHAARHRGYRAAVEGAGLGYDPDLVARVGTDPASGASALNRMRALPEPATAGYFTNPMLAVGAIRRAHALGLRLPGDFSVLGFDDERTRFDTWPQMTAVCQNTGALGFEAAQWLTRRLDRDDATVAGAGASAVGDAGDVLRLESRTFFEVHDTTGRPTPADPEAGDVPARRATRGGAVLMAR